jgi:hypothetical protein
MNTSLVWELNSYDRLEGPGAQCLSGQGIYRGRRSHRLVPAAHNGWFTVRQMIPAGATRDALTWIITPTLMGRVANLYPLFVAFPDLAQPPATYTAFWPPMRCSKDSCSPEAGLIV